MRRELLRVGKPKTVWHFSSSHCRDKKRDAFDFHSFRRAVDAVTHFSFKNNCPPVLSSFSESQRVADTSALRWMFPLRT